MYMDKVSLFRGGYSVIYIYGGANVGCPYWKIHRLVN